MATEKTQQNLFAGIEGFDSTKLKHAETQEKNPLPDKDGNYYDLFLFLLFIFSRLAHFLVYFVSLFNILLIICFKLYFT